MKNHWDRNLNVSQLVKEHKPKLIVELGGGGGDNTDQYIELQKTLHFKMITISDGNMPERYKGNDDFQWIFGISYLELPKFPDHSIDFCSIDTDHNYWTLYKELEILNDKMKVGGMVVMHDTESYRNQSGVMMSYLHGDDYPRGITENQHIGMRQALQDHLDCGNYKLIKETKDSCGACAIIKL